MSDDIIDETATADEASHAEGSNRARRRSAHREEHAAPRLWARARGAFFALPRGLHVVMLIIFMILGFALVTQVRAQRSDPLEGLSEQDLVTVLDELGTREQNLRARRAELTSELEDLQSAADDAQAREQASAKAALQAQIAAGTVAVQGPGVSVSVLDPGDNLSPTQFVMTLGELRNAGAEAIDLNGVRHHALRLHGAGGGHRRGRHTHRLALHVDRHRRVSDDRDRPGDSGRLRLSDARQGRHCHDHADRSRHD